MSYAEKKKIGTNLAMLTLGFVFAPLIYLAATDEPVIVPDDPELATFIVDNFPELSQAIENAGEQILIYDANDRINDIHDLMVQNGSEDFDFSRLDYLRLGAMGDAADLFNSVANDGFYIRSLQCDASDSASHYTCNFIIAEKGGIVEVGNEFYDVAACTTARYSATVIPTEDGLNVSTNSTRTSSYERRIMPENALQGHTDMSQFTEGNPHEGPITLDEITTTSHVNFHEGSLRTGGFSWSYGMTLLGEEQVPAERVLALLSECVKGHEQQVEQEVEAVQEPLQEPLGPE